MQIIKCNNNKVYIENEYNNKANLTFNLNINVIYQVDNINFNAILEIEDSLNGFTYYYVDLIKDDFMYFSEYIYNEENKGFITIKKSKKNKYKKRIIKNYKKILKIYCYGIDKESFYEEKDYHYSR